MTVDLYGKYADCELGVQVECRVYQHGHCDGKHHVEKLIGIETVSISKSARCMAGLGSSTHVKRIPYGRSYPLLKDEDGAFCIVI